MMYFAAKLMKNIGFKIELANHHNLVCNHTRKNLFFFIENSNLAAEAFLKLSAPKGLKKLLNGFKNEGA